MSDSQASAETRAKAERLRQEISRHNHLYFVLAKPEVTDSEYDRMFRELVDLELGYPELAVPDSPTRRVGAPPASGFAEVVHPLPLLSLSNVFDREELEAWYRRACDYGDLKGFDLICELKIDGLAVSLTYEDGVFVRGGTRGDGERGEDVTANLRTIRSIPLRLHSGGYPPIVEVRGEVYYPAGAFEQLNREREVEGEPLYVNPRNAASGALRQLDSRVTARRPLDFFAYAIGHADGGDLPTTQWDTLEQLKEWGFHTPPWARRAKSLDEVLAAFDEVVELRKSLDFGIDGIVVKADERRVALRLGHVAREPRWATAFKFAAEQVTTVLKEIRVNVGRTGSLNPYAVLEPVFVGGVMVSQATLHNEDDIRRKDIRQGDTVIVQRAGEVIPQVVGPVLEKRPPGTVEYRVPRECPSCGQPAVRDEAEAVVRCVNAKCPAQFHRLLEHFAARGAMDIEGLGVKLSAELIAAGLVHDIADVFALEARREDLLQLDRMGEKSVDNLIQAIRGAQQRPLARLLYALGIPHVGAETAELLAGKFGSLASLQSATIEQIDEVEGIGPEIARNVAHWFEARENQDVIGRLVAAGVNPVEAPRVGPGPRPFDGKRFVVTGSLERFTRSEAQSRIKSLGGLVSGSVSKKTDFVVVGAEPGSKLDDANRLGVRTITEEQFVEMLNKPELARAGDAPAGRA